MAGLKQWEPALRFGGYQVTPDEVDRYEIYQIVNPGTWNRSWASAGTAGTSSNIALVIINAMPDYPRNIRFALAGSHASMAGTLTVNGYDQFGSAQTEVMSFSGSDNGGTVIGTSIFARITSGTLNYGTAVGAGTPAIGFVTTGTTCLFGLPVRLYGTTDVVHLSHVAGTGMVTVNGGTIAGFVDVPRHCIKAPQTITGTECINVWIKTRYNHDNIASAANLVAAT